MIWLLNIARNKILLNTNQITFYLFFLCMDWGKKLFSLGISLYLNVRNYNSLRRLLIKNLLWFILQWHLQISGVSVWSSNPGSIHLGIKRRRKKSKERIGSFTRAYGVIQRWNRFIMVHPHNPLPNRPPYPHLKQQACCTVSVNTDQPQEYKTALMPHLLKQQDCFKSLDPVLNS